MRIPPNRAIGRHRRWMFVRSSRFPGRAGRNGQREDRADSTPPHTVRWTVTDYAVGQRVRALRTGVAASSERPDTPLGPPHSADLGDGGWDEKQDRTQHSHDR